MVALKITILTSAMLALVGLGFLLGAQVPRLDLPLAMSGPDFGSVAANLKSSGEPTQAKKKAVFLETLDPKMDDRVQDLRARPWPLLGPAEREKVERSLADFARAGGRDKTEPKMSDVVSQAYASLREVGEGAIPELIDATTNEDPWVRTRALSAIFQIARTEGQARTNVMALFLPVFARSCWDKNADVRGSVLAQVGNVGLSIQTEVIALLQRGLEDDDETAQNMAGKFLFRLGRKDLVPEELIRKYGVGTYK